MNDRRDMQGNARGKTGTIIFIMISAVLIIAGFFVSPAAGGLLTVILFFVTKIYNRSSKKLRRRSMTFGELWLAIAQSYSIVCPDGSIDSVDARRFFDTARSYYRNMNGWYPQDSDPVPDYIFDYLEANYNVRVGRYAKPQ